MLARQLIQSGRIRGEQFADDELTRKQLRERRRYEFARWLRKRGRIGA